MAALSRGCKPRIILLIIWITCPYGSTLHAIPFDCKRQDSNLISRESGQILQNSNQCWRPDCHFISFQFLEFFICDSNCTVKHFVTTQYSMNVKFIRNWVPLDCYLSWARLVKCSNVNGRLTWGYKKERKTNYDISAQINFPSGLAHIWALQIPWLSIHHLHTFHDTPCLPPKRLYNLCYSFLMNITVVSREIKNISYAKLLRGVGGRGWGQPRCTKAEVQMANDFFPFSTKFSFCHFWNYSKRFGDFLPNQF